MQMKVTLGILMNTDGYPWEVSSCYSGVSGPEVVWFNNHNASLKNKRIF